jgi:hypothetical protein
MQMPISAPLSRSFEIVVVLPSPAAGTVLKGRVAGAVPKRGKLVGFANMAI